MRQPRTIEVKGDRRDAANVNAAEIGGVERLKRER
jgi:hypothetical protein